MIRKALTVLAVSGGLAFTAPAAQALALPSAAPAAAVLPALPAPASVHASAWAHHARVSWSAVSGASRYELSITGAGGAGSGATRFDRALPPSLRRGAVIVLGPGRYVARVRGERSFSNVRGHWSAGLRFTVPVPRRAAPGAGRAARALAWAYLQAGKWYAWGGSGPSSFDCSGLVMAAYARADGIGLPHNTGQMLGSGKLARTGSPVPGDLAFYGTGHVEMYVRPGVTFGAHHAGTRIGFSYYRGSSWQPSGFYRVA